MNDGGFADCGAVRVMEVVWPSGIALREEVPNHCALRPLTAVRGERHRKRRAMSTSGAVREDGWKYLSLTRRNPLSRHRNRDRLHISGLIWRLPVYCPGGVRRTGSMSPDKALVRNV